MRPRKCRVNVRNKYSRDVPLEFSVPQGSCAGPVLYLAYASTMREALPCGLDLHGYADDHAVKVRFPINKRQEETEAIRLLENSAITIKSWMDANRLKMNNTKTEFAVFASSAQLKQCHTKSINVNGEDIERSNSIKYLGAALDANLKLKQHIANKCRTAMYNLQRIKHIRPFLTEETCHTIVQGLVMSHIDYANSLYHGLPNNSIKKLQRVQNMAAKTILRKKRENSSKDCLEILHWLPIRQRVEHKILTLVFKCLRDEAPKYLSELLMKSETGVHYLRSQQEEKLVVPNTKRKTFADRSSSVAGPRLWNMIPNDIKQSKDVGAFKRKLKTYLYNKTFTSVD